MRKLLVNILFVLSPFLIQAQIANPFYLVAKKNTISGVEYIRLGWKADRRDLTVRNYVAVEGSSTFAGIGPAGGFDSTVIGRTTKYLDDQQAGAMTWFTYAASGYSARKFIEEGAFVDPVRNINYAVRYAYLNTTQKEFPKLFLFQDANNWVADGVSTAQNLEYIHSILTKAVQFGATVILADVQPRETYTAPQRQLIEDLHTALKARYGNNQFPNIRFAGRWYDTVTVQTAKTIRTDYTAGDEIHLNNLGHRKFFEDHIKPIIDSIYAVSTTVARHQIDVADNESGPWTLYRNVNKDTGFVNLPMTNRTKFFRVKTVFNDSSQTQWSNIAFPVDKPLMPKEFIDQSGVSRDKMGSGFHHLRWFDGFSTHDPKYNGLSDLDTIGASTLAYPNRPFHYPKDISDGNGMGNYRGDRGWLMWLDLSNDKDQFRLLKYRITGVYGLQQGGDFVDTLELYNGDFIFNQPAHERWKYTSRPDSLMTPFYRLAQGHAIGYKPEWSGGPTGAGQLGDSMRYVLVRIVRKNRGSYFTFPTFGELVFYGEQLYSSDTLNYKNFNYTGPLPKRQPAAKMLGVNNVGVLLSQLKYDGVSREYIAGGNYDSSTVAYPNNRIDPNPFNFGASYWAENFGQAATEGRLWFETIRAGSKRLEVQGWGNVAKSLPVTEGGMEPESPYSYERFGNLAYHYAALFGNNPNHNDSNFRWTNKSQLPGYGLGWRKASEWGNEDQTRGSTLQAEVVKDLVCFDGWEGTFPRTGVKTADSTHIFVESAGVYNDTSYIKGKIFLSRLFRNDRKVIYQWFNGHEYPRKYTNPAVQEHDPTFEEQVGTRGATFEEVGLGADIEATEKVIWRETGDTSKRFILTEYGYDNWSTPPSSVADLTFGPPYFALWTISCTPKVTGRDSLVGKGWLQVRNEVRMMLTHMQFACEFMITNVFFDPDNNFPGLFARSGRGAASVPGGPSGSNIEIPTKFANYWTRASFYNIIKGYIGDTLLSYDSVGMCLAKFRNIAQPDSVCYVQWKGSWNGSSLSSQTINVGAVTGNAVVKSLSSTTPAPVTTFQAVSGGNISTNPTEEPKFYFVQEVIPSSTIIKYLLRKIPAD